MPSKIKCSKFTLMVMNMFIFVAGASLLVAGLMLLLTSGFLGRDVLGLLVTIKEGSLQYGLKLMVVTCAMIAIGALVLIMGVLGMCASYQKITCCLITYIIFAVLCILLEGALGGLCINLRGETDEWLEGQLSTQLNSFAGPTATDAISAGFNQMFITARCCGVAGYGDFNSNSNAWYQNTGMGNSEKIPATCCKGVITDNINDYVNSSCTQTPTDYYTEGCYSVLQTLVKKHSIIVYVCTSVAALMKILAILLSCILMDNSSNRVHSGSEAKPPPYIGIDAIMKKKRTK